MEKEFLQGIRWALMDWRRRRIKAARIERGRSAQQVADAAGWGITTQRKMESGARGIADGELWSIARALEIDVAYFLDESLEPFPTVHVVAQAKAPASQSGRVPSSSPQPLKAKAVKDRPEAGRRSGT